MPARSLPDGAALLAREAAVRRPGTGLVAADLHGCWQLEQVWPRGRSQPASFSAALLRGLSASLQIWDEDGQLRLRNRVSLGPLELCFEGPGWLRGARPLLMFRFHQLQLRLAGRTLLQRQLPEPAPQRLPFFALIQRDPAGWLAARGRGGGLALWQLADPQP